MQHKRVGYGLMAAVAVGVAVSACSNTASDTQASSSTSAAASAPSTSAASSDAAHNDADVAFAQGMIPHHQQAIEMSDMLLGKQGIQPQIVTLANQIKNAQAPEIDQMQGWLQQWGAGSTPASSSSPMPGHDMSGGDMSRMPTGSGHGMMSDADMAALQNAQGTEAGRLFLTQMIKHHEGAITMAQQEIDSGQFPAAVDMARTIVSSQQQEITTMQGLLNNQ